MCYQPKSPILWKRIKIISEVEHEQKNPLQMLQALENLYLSCDQKLNKSKATFYLLDDFLTDRECDELLKRITLKCRPSTISMPKELDQNLRTSKTCDLCMNTDKFV